MLDQSSSAKDDLKTQFVTREGTYRLMTLSEYSRPNRVGYTSNQSSPQVRVSIVSLPQSSTPTAAASASNPSSSAKVVHNNENHSTSTMTDHHLLPEEKISPTGIGGGPLQVHQVTSTTSNTNLNNNNQTDAVISGGDRICFNFGKELFVYAYRGAKKVPFNANLV